MSRPLRLLHPRHPVYVVPRDDQQFMIGATMIENDERGRVTARSLVELAEFGLWRSIRPSPRPETPKWAPTCVRPLRTTCRA